MKVFLVLIATIISLALIADSHALKWVAFDRCDPLWRDDLHGNREFDCEDSSIVPVPNGFRASFRTLLATILATNDIPCGVGGKRCRPDRLLQLLRRHNIQSEKDALDALGLAVARYYSGEERVKEAIDHGKIVIINILSDYDLCVLGISVSENGAKVLNSRGKIEFYPDEKIIDAVSIRILPVDTLQ
jgi:hypothetical protein